MTSGYVFLPHTTDSYIEATGSTFEEALEYAAMGLFDTLCEVTSVSPKLTDTLEVTGTDDLDFLYSWLEALLLKFELEGKVYSKFHVNPVVVSNGEVIAYAQVSGEPFDRRKHGAKVEVKAVTYHKMQILRGQPTIIRFILDL